MSLIFSSELSFVAHHSSNQFHSYPADVESQREAFRAVARILFLAALVLMLVAKMAAQGSVTVKTYPTSDAGRITLGPDGALWFTETNASRIGRITTSGVLTEFSLPKSNSYPLGITVGPDGALWFTEVYKQTIGRITTDGTITEFPVAGSPSSDFLSEITAGPDGALWFNKWCSGISRMTIAGVVTDYPTMSCPTDIVAGPDGAMWWSDAVYRVGRITTSGVITQYSLPGYFLHSIAVGSDNALWFTGDIPSFNGPYAPTVGRITTSGAIKLYNLESWGFHPFLIAPGPDGVLWFTNPDDNYDVSRITTSGVPTKFQIGGPCRYPYNPFNGIVRAGTDMWFSCSNGGIVQLTINDTTPPVITMQSTPKYLWPANGQMVPVTVSGNISDARSGAATNSLTYSVVDEYVQFQPNGHFTIDAAGNYSFTIGLLAEVAVGDADGARHYGVVISASDNAGNRNSQWRFAIVTRNRQ